MKHLIQTVVVVVVALVIYHALFGRRTDGFDPSIRISSDIDGPNYGPGPTRYPNDWTSPGEGSRLSVGDLIW